MKLAPIALLIALLGCQEHTTPAGRERTELVYISGNQLPADGCEELVRIAKDSASASTVRYKPTSASLPILRKSLNTTADSSYSPGEKLVKMRFIETGKQVTLECGWGARPQVPEIEILGITER
jgi:hypothetical protein